MSTKEEEMEIAVDTNKLRTIAKKSHRARANANTATLIERDKADRGKRQRLYEYGQEELKRMVVLIPNALKKAAKDGYETEDGWHIEAEILVAEAPMDDLYPNRFNRYLREEDAATIEAIERSLSDLNRENRNKGIWLKIKVDFRLKTAKDKHPNLGKHDKFLHQFFLVATATIPEK